jgi:hypothetical protein
MKEKTVLRIRHLSWKPNPDFLPIPDPDSRIHKPQQKRGGEKVSHTFILATNFTKLKIILF